jgi:alpha-mannosidase
MGRRSSTAEICSQCIEAAIARLRELTQCDRQTDWRMSLEDADASIQCDPRQWTNWQPVTLNDHQHIAWPAGRQVLWLGQAIEMPTVLTGADYPLAGFTARLAITWWAEQADVYVNGQLVQQGDLFDTSARIVLAESLVPGTDVTVAVRLVSPAHDAGALVRSHFLCEPSTGDCIDPGMVADELAVLQTYLSAFRPDGLETLAAAVKGIAWQKLGDIFQQGSDADAEGGEIAFDQSLQHLRHQLSPFAQWMKQRQIDWIGHAHLDLAWLWPVAETWEAAERTFVSALNLQRDFQELNFCHSSPALYEWIEQHRPTLFAQIQQRVAEGRWEVAAGLWIEPELNLISGESLVRQVLYGQRYTQQHFGHISRVAWLPDSFGFCNQLPQILKQGGVDYFLTQKLRWNDTTQFPHEAFWWQAPDGTRIFSIMTPPIGESIDPIKMGNYAQVWEAKTQLQKSFWLPGVGDHGGGPTRDMLEVARKWQQSPLFPQLKSSTMTEFCQQVEDTLQDVPVWTDELYLEFHRGCYTSHADQKRYNRRCEHLLAEAEMFSAIATLLTQAPYPKATLESAWKKMLFNQFHDILPGSSISEVFADANRDWEWIQQTALELREQAWEAIAAEIRLPELPVSDAVPILVYNSLNWERSEVVSWQIPDHLPTGGSVWDTDGFPTGSHSEDRTLSFWAEMPSVGYRIFWYGPTTPSQQPKPETPRDWILDNGLLQVEVCPTTGTLKSVWDETAQREVLAGAGNQLQFFQDQGQYWDAWNIDPNYAKHALEATTLKEIAWVCSHGLQQRLRVVLQWRSSVFNLDYVLDWGSPVLKIVIQTDWQETHVLVKAAFPVTVAADHATYEIPCGAIKRPTLPNPHSLSEHEQAKWEVPALHWADLTQADGSYGVSLLNDCKYGYDAQPDCLRLTLLRSPRWPDPACDRGIHHFTYVLYPHSGSWQSAHTVRRGYELNRPLIAQTLQSADTSKTLPPTRSFFSNFAANLVLMAFKQSEDAAQQWVMRCYEACGQSAPLNLTTTLPLQCAGSLDGLEQPLSETSDKIEPWQVRSQAWAQLSLPEIVR